MRVIVQIWPGAGGGFFSSIHANANPNPNFRGFMVFTLSELAADRYGQEVIERDDRADELGAVADVEEQEVVDIFPALLSAIC